MDLERFLATEETYWAELAAILHRMQEGVGNALTLEELKRFHYLYQRASSDLAQLAAFPNEPGVRRRLEALVAPAYADVHETRRRSFRVAPVPWALRVFPRTFRRQSWAFGLCVAATLLGCALGAILLYVDHGSKPILLPFSHLQGDPADRVAYEESQTQDRLAGRAASFSAMLMTHNIRVSIFAMALGMTFGFGTILLIFYNGVIMGAITCDYVLAGEGTFLTGWLLPHGAIEIPAILIAGQGGLVLGRALIGHGDCIPVRQRLRAVREDLLTLMYGAAILLVWAGVIEAFLSQYHEPVISYTLKIGFGALELVLLSLYLTLMGRRTSDA